LIIGGGVLKQKIRIFIAIFLVCVFILANSVQAFTNSDYYNNQNINIGLESMQSSQLNITLNGDYTLNGVVYKSGTSYVLKVSGTQIDLNGKLYANVTFIPQNNSNTIKIVSSYTRNYLGTLAFKIDSSSGTSKVMPINTLNIEAYLKGVVGKEMSEYYPIEALKAQAVAARNYAIASIGKHKAKGYNLCDTIDCQVYGGYDASLKNVIAAVDATKGMLLLSGTNIVNAYYSASDGGYTEDSVNVWGGTYPYLITKKDDFDIDYTWNRKFTTASIKTVIAQKSYLKIPANYTFVKIDLSSITKFDSGRIKNISLIFKDQYQLNHTLSYGKDTARTFLSLPSGLYEVSYDSTTDTYSFDGKGNGHGVGMSQIGAKYRAIAGQNFENILKFYYEGTTLINALPNSTVSFDSQGGSTVMSKSVGYNSAITAPGTPTKAGYTFAGWYKEAECINSWSFTTDKVTANTTLYAKWVMAIPATPTSVKALSSSYNSINISWSGVTAASGYEVYSATSSAGTYTLISTTTATSYKDTELTTNSTYYYKVRAYKMDSTAKEYSGFSTITSSELVNVQRLSGTNRIETSIAIAKEQYTDKAPEAVVLATANNFADALAGSGLAYKYNAPLLLVNKTVSDSKQVLDYITTNLSKTKNIYILGATGAVSKEISDYLTVQGYNIIRLGGKNRYETNEKIVDYLNTPKDTSIIIATGENFADALSISSIAGIKGYPILLNGRDNLSASVSNDIINIQPKTVYITGGTGVLSDNIVTQIKKLNGAINIVRLGGENRYETSMKIIEYFNLTTTTITVATGTDFPDTLSGSVLAARMNSGVLLVNKNDITKQKDLLDKQNITRIIVFGGAGAISNDIATSLMPK